MLPKIVLTLDCLNKLFQWSQKICNSRPSASNFKSFFRSLEQLFLTVGQSNFGNKIPFFYFRFNNADTTVWSGGKFQSWWNVGWGVSGAKANKNQNNVWFMPYSKCSTWCQNWRQTWDVYLPLAILLGQMYEKLNYRLVTGQFISYKYVNQLIELAPSK